MYKQSIQNIHLAILSLDGIILDLNRLRFNYYKHLASSKNITITGQQFSNALCNMYDMYNALPLRDLIDSGPLNAKIERELMEYSRYKGISVKEGVYEFIEYLKQKDIPIAIFSTHRTKDACEYLKMVDLYSKVHFIIGSDTSSLPLPSTSILETICSHFKVACKETLVLSSFEALNKAAVSLNMNIIYLEDFCEANDFVKKTSYRIASDMFDALNVMLFEKYESVDMYSPLLKMDENMSEIQLQHAYQNAIETYNDDSSLMELVDRTYHYHLSQLKPTPTKKHFSFEDQASNVDKEIEVQEQNKQIKEELYEEPAHIQMRSLSKTEEEELASILKQINRTKEPIKEEVVINNHQEVIDDEIEERQDYSLIKRMLLQFSYILLVSLFILLLGITFSIAFIHPLQSNQGLFGIIAYIFNIYNQFVQSCASFIIDTLHQLFSFIPSYNTYLLNSYISKDGLLLVHIYISNVIILSLFNFIYYFIKKGMKKDVQ